MGMQANETTFRSYILFWAGQLTTLLGSSMAQFVIIWWITATTESALYLALGTFLGFAPMVLLAPLAGVFVDRWSRKKLIGVVDFLQAMATLVLVLLFWQSLISIWVVFALLTLRGVFQAFHAPAVSAIIPLMVPKEKLSRINGLNYLFTGAVNMVGPIVAAVLLEVWQIHEVLWIDVATFLIALVPLLAIGIPSLKPRIEQSSFKTQFLEGFGFIRNTRGLLTLLFLATALNLLLTPISTLFPYYVKVDHLGTAPVYALVGAVFQGGMIAGGIAMTMTKGFKRKMAAAAVSIFVIFLAHAFVAFTPTGWFWFMAICMATMAFCLPIANVSIQTIFQTVVPVGMLGRVSSVTLALASAAMPAGMILSGVFVQFMRTADLYFGCAVLGMISITLSWFGTDIRHVEKLEPTIDAEKTPQS